MAGLQLGAAGVVGSPGAAALDVINNYGALVEGNGGGGRAEMFGFYLVEITRAVL